MGEAPNFPNRRWNLVFDRCPPGEVWDVLRNACVPNQYIKRTVYDAMAAYQAAPNNFTQWYEEAQTFVEMMFPDERIRALWVDLLSATSIQTSTDVNIAMACAAMRAFAEGIPYDQVEYLPGRKDTFGTRVRAVHRVIDGEGFGESSQKISQFSRAILGDVDAVAVDTHVAEWFFKGQKDTPMRRRLAMGWIRQAAAELEVNGRDLQASIWWVGAQMKGKTVLDWTESAMRNQATIIEMWRMIKGFGDSLQPPDATVVGQGDDPAELDEIHAVMWAFENMAQSIIRWCSTARTLGERSISLANEWAAKDSTWTPYVVAGVAALAVWLASRR